MSRKRKATDELANARALVAVTFGFIAMVAVIGLVDEVMREG